MLASLYFLGSTLITWWFITACQEMYDDGPEMLYSCIIAGAKWSVQIVMALFILHEKRWIFLRRIGFTCFIGSVILLPLCIIPIRAAGWSKGFLTSIICSVAVMIVLYYRSVRRTGLSMFWFNSWIVCLAIAILLQLTVVFHVL